MKSSVPILQIISQVSDSKLIFTRLRPALSIVGHQPQVVAHAQAAEGRRGHSRHVRVGLVPGRDLSITFDFM